MDLHRVLDHGHVALYDSMANDLSVVNSARISFNKRKDLVELEDLKLINYLMRERHGTPFEHNAFTFDVKAPIFVVREWQRHRICSYNEMSARYTELPAEWYIPEPQFVRQRVGKPGQYKYIPLPGVEAVEYLDELRSQCQDSYAAYKRSLDMGVAPEQARLFLHVNHYTQMFWTINARSLMNFLSLRNSSSAQWEIRQFADAVETIFASKMPVVYASFVKHGRISP